MTTTERLEQVRDFRTITEIPCSSIMQVQEVKHCSHCGGHTTFLMSLRSAIRLHNEKPQDVFWHVDTDSFVMYLTGNHIECQVAMYAELDAQEWAASHPISRTRDHR